MYTENDQETTSYNWSIDMRIQHWSPLFEGNPPETIEDGENLTTTTTTMTSEDIETTTINEGAAPEVSDDSSFENELNQNKTTNATEKPKICNQTVVFGILLTVQVYT